MWKCPNGCYNYVIDMDDLYPGQDYEGVYHCEDCGANWSIEELIEYDDILASEAKERQP